MPTTWVAFEKYRYPVRLTRRLFETLFLFPHDDVIGNYPDE
jgi:hypothetical protein